MKRISAIIIEPSSQFLSSNINLLRSLDAFEEIKVASLGHSFAYALSDIKTEYTLLVKTKGQIEFSGESLSELLKNIEEKKAAIVYSDYLSSGSKVLLNDYLLGSFRDDFDFGGLILLSNEKIKKVIEKYKGLRFEKYGALYDLRLKISLEYPIVRIPKPLYTLKEVSQMTSHEAIFSYVDPKNEEYQKEMETIFTFFLKEKGAYIPPDTLKKVDAEKENYPCELSVIVPVKDRKETIIEALESAVCQKTNFSFNIIVVDNYSVDGTSKLVEDFSKKYPNVKRICPKIKGLNIGGCWNEAINSPFCGRYAVQLDSDDLFSTPFALQMIYDKLKEGNYAMVVGSYKTVDEKKREIPPGLVSHTEWSDDNGHNNLLRVGGIGAPRAYCTSILRKMQFRDISYGEDYEMALRISREYKIGRIRTCLYLARRWAKNTDSELSNLKKRELFEIKDRMRGEELTHRIEYVRKKQRQSRT